MIEAVLIFNKNTKKKDLIGNVDRKQLSSQQYTQLENTQYIIRVYYDFNKLDLCLSDLRHDVINNFNNINGYKDLIKLENMEVGNLDIEDYTNAIETNINQSIDNIRSTIDLDHIQKTFNLKKTSEND